MVDILVCSFFGSSFIFNLKGGNTKRHVLEMEPRAWHVLGRLSSAELSLALECVCY